jgi:iron complex transport system substrate-binding protein
MHTRSSALSVSLALAVCLLAPAVLAAQAASAWPRAVIDDLGASVSLAQKPARIVSLTLPTDEILLSLVTKNRIAAVTGFSEDTSLSNVVSQVFDIPVKLPQLNIEVVISLKPDLVFVADWTDPASVKQLRAAGLAVYQFKSPGSVKAIEDSIVRIGSVVGEESAAKKLTQWMQARLAAVASRLSALPAEKRLSVMDWGTWGTASGAGSSWDEIVRLAGLKNAVADLKADQYGSVPMSKELILQIDPDILMLPAWVYGDAKGSDTFFTNTVNDPAFKGLKALKSARVHRMAENLKTATSQYIVFAVEDLARYAYPELFK